MNKLNIAIFSLIIFALVLWLKLSGSVQNGDTKVYMNYKNNETKELISETSYISYPNGEYEFIICKSRNNVRPPCEIIKGVRHGLEKWYKNGILKYEDMYENGLILNTTIYYDNGLLAQEIIYKNGIVFEKKIYSKEMPKELVESITYMSNETLKKSYINGRMEREERYRDGKLVSRRIYDKDGLLKHLEEYSGNLEELFEPFMYNERPKQKSKKAIPQDDISSVMDGVWI